MGDRRDNEGGEPRSAAQLGAAASMQALAEVQRRGLLAAGDLVDRLVRVVDGDGEGGDGDGTGNSGGGVPNAGAGAHARGGPRSTGPTDDLVRLWADVVRLGLDTFGQFLTPVAARGPDGTAATVDVATGGSTGAVRLVVVRAGSPPTARATDAPGAPGAEVWLHNADAREHAGLRLHSGELRASDGAALPAGSVRFDPDVVDLPGRSSRGVVVSVDTDAPAGTYRGLILTAGVPEAWLPIEVVVSADEPGGPTQ